MSVIHDHNKVPQLLERFDKLSRFGMEIGIFQDGEGGNKHPGSNITILDIASIHEFGAPSVNIPERSFIRSTFDDKLGKITNTLAEQYYDYIEGNIDYDAMTNTIGEYLVGQVQETISRMTTPALKASTIARKGSSGVLRDTGRLIGAITFKVKEG